MIKINTRPTRTGNIYNKEYYVAKAIFGSEKFKKFASRINRKFDKKSFVPPYRRRPSKFTVYKTSDLLEELELKNVDLLKEIDNILANYGIDEFEYEDYFKYVSLTISKLLYDQEPEFEPDNCPSLFFDDDDNPQRLFLEIYPWTTLKHLKTYMPTVSVYQSKMKNGVFKIKKWDKFERDLELYKLYRRIKEEKLNVTASSGAHVRDAKSPIVKLLNTSEFALLQKKYGEIDEDNLKKSIRRAEKVFGNIKLN